MNLLFLRSNFWRKKVFFCHSRREKGKKTAYKRPLKLIRFADSNSDSNYFVVSINKKKPKLNKQHKCVPSFSFPQNLRRIKIFIWQTKHIGTSDGTEIQTDRLTHRHFNFYIQSAKRTVNGEYIFILHCHHNTYVGLTLEDGWPLVPGDRRDRRRGGGCHSTENNFRTGLTIMSIYIIERDWQREAAIAV